MLQGLYQHIVWWKEDLHAIVDALNGIASSISQRIAATFAQYYSSVSHGVHLGGPIDVLNLYRSA